MERLSRLIKKLILNFASKRIAKRSVGFFSFGRAIFRNRRGRWRTWTFLAKASVVSLKVHLALKYHSLFFFRPRLYDIGTETAAFSKPSKKVMISRMGNCHNIYFDVTDCLLLHGFSPDSDFIVNDYLYGIYDALRTQVKRVIAVNNTGLSHEEVGMLLARTGYQVDEIVPVPTRRDYRTMSRAARLEWKGGNAGRRTQEICIMTGDYRRYQYARRKSLNAFCYVNPDLLGLPFRVPLSSAQLQGAYHALVNRTLYGGDRAMRRWFEFGFLYAGLLSLGFCFHIRERVLRAGAEKVLFLSDVSANLLDIYSNVLHFEGATELPYSAAVDRAAADETGDARGLLQALLVQVLAGDQRVCVVDGSADGRSSRALLAALTTLGVEVIAVRLCADNDQESYIGSKRQSSSGRRIPTAAAYLYGPSQYELHAYKYTVEEGLSFVYGLQSQSPFVRAQIAAGARRFCSDYVYNFGQFDWADKITGEDGWQPLDMALRRLDYFRKKDQVDSI